MTVADTPSPAASASPEQLRAAHQRAEDLITFVDPSPTPYHAVAEIVRRLEAAGFTALDEREPWALSSGDRRYVVRSQGSIAAFQVGEKSPVESGFTMVGAHTDSPNLKLKPRAAYSKAGVRQVGVEVYGGVLLSTWLDRDLSVAGRVSVPDGDGVRAILVDLKRPLLRVPNLAIHLNREINRDGLKLNKQDHMAPIWGLADSVTEETALLAKVAEAAGVEVDTILDHDLSLYDTQGGVIAGFDEAFVHTARLDNLASCHSGLSALLGTVDTPVDGTRMIVFWDHEEIGSRSAQGAAGPFLRTTLSRVVDAIDGDAAQGSERALARSFMVSADMAHAIHPNYADRHDPRHTPKIGHGPVIKTNANQSYATDGESAARFIAVCKEAGFTPQAFVTRTDLACGSTIGPISAAELGVKTVDIGNPMLSMHSCREMAGVYDLELMHQALLALFKTA